MKHIKYAVASFTLALCMGPHLAAAQVAAPIKIGVILPLSGGAGPDGQSVLGGIKLVVDDLNKAGGLLGRKIEVLAKDDESTPAIGISRANELIGEKVDVVIEGWNSPVTLAMQPLLARANMLDITAVSKADPILAGQVNPYAIRINSSNVLDAQAISDYVVKSLKAKKIGFLTQNDTYGNGFQELVEADLKKLDPTTEVVITEKFPLKQTDFRVALTNIKQVEPDVVIVTNSSNSSGLPALVQQYHQAGVKSQMVGAVGIMLPTVFKIAGADANGAITADMYFADLPPFSGLAENQAFVAQHQAAYGKQPDKSAALGAIAVQAWAHAVKQTQSLDRKTVAEAIRGQTIPSTVIGDATFAPNGQLQPRYVVVKVSDGANGKFTALGE